MIHSLSNDFLIRIKNGSLAGRKTIVAPASKFCTSIAALMKKTGFIEDYSVSDEVGGRITVTLAYKNGLPAVTDIRLFSRPGRRYYEKSFSLPWGQTKDSLIIVSTSSGVKSQKEARKLGIGGEIIAEIQ